MPPLKTAKPIRRIRKRIHFYMVRLPLIYILLPIGFLFEFIITFPFMVMTGLDAERTPKRRPGR